MAINAAHWTITRTTGDIRYIGGDHDSSPSYITGLELHRWANGLLDDESSGSSDDQADITDGDISVRSTDNIFTLQGTYNITATEAEHIFDCTIIQGTSGVDEERWDGIVNYGNADVQIQIIQDGAVLADDWWNQSGVGLNPNATSGISHRFMIKVIDADAETDGRRLIGTCRTFGNTYAEFLIAGTNPGNNTLALVDANDGNNNTIEGTVSGWTGITNTTEGYAAIDVDNNSTDEYYYSEWNTTQPALDINDFYERMKWLTRDGSVSTLYGLNGELFRGITHEIDVTNIQSGPLDAVEELTWTEATISSSGQMLATDSVSAPGTVWIQLLTGLVPTDGVTMTGTSSSATIDVDTNITSRTISKPFVGASTGTALIGAYGLGVEKADLLNTDKVIDLGGNEITPPNNVTFTVYGIESGDRVIVTNDESTGIDYDQLTLDGVHAASAGTITIIEDIPDDTPESGTIRVYNDDDEYMRLPYTSWTGKVFTLTGTTPTGAASADNVFVSYIDKATSSTSEAFTTVYDAPRTMFIRVREGTSGTPIKTAETTGALGTSGGSATVNRIDDY